MDVFGGGEEQKGEEEAEEEGSGVAGTASREADNELLGREEDRDGWLDCEVVCQLLRNNEIVVEKTWVGETWVSLVASA